MHSPALIELDRMDFWVRHALAEIQGGYGDICTVSGKLKSLLKFGQNEAVGTSEATIMEFAGSETSETYATLGTNPVDSLSCTDASFVGDIYIEGHVDDGAGNLSFSTQTVTATGQTRAPLTTNLARVTRAECADETAFSATTTDKVYVFENGALTDGVPDTASNVHLVMSAIERQSKKASTAISSSDYALITKIYADINKKTGALADIRFRVRSIGVGTGRRPGGFKTKLIRTLNTAGVSGFEFEPRPFIIVPKNSDVIMTGVGSTTGVSISAGFDSILVKVS